MLLFLCFNRITQLFFLFLVRFEFISVDYISFVLDKSLRYGYCWIKLEPLNVFQTFKNVQFCIFFIEVSFTSLLEHYSFLVLLSADSPPVLLNVLAVITRLSSVRLFSQVETCFLNHSIFRCCSISKKFKSFWLNLRELSAEISHSGLVWSSYPCIGWIFILQFWA